MEYVTEMDASREVGQVGEFHRDGEKWGGGLSYAGLSDAGGCWGSSSFIDLDPRGFG